jgi:biopolymer transport protein TolR
MRVPATAQLGVAVIVAAVAGYWGSKFWLETRTLRAVDIPISLARGTVKTGIFKLNVHGLYSITIGRTHGGDLVCSSGVGLETRRISSIGGLPVYRYQWLEDQGRSTGRNTIPGGFLGGFEGIPGVYDLQIEVVSDTGCLDANKPRLYVIASKDDFDKWNQRYENSCTLWILIGLVGFVLMVAGMIQAVRERSDAKRNPSIFYRRGILSETRPLPWKPSRAAALRAAKRRPVFYARMDVTALAAVLLALLIMFMAHGGGFVGQHGVGVDLPHARNSTQQPGARREDVIMIAVTRDGNTYLNSSKVQLPRLPDLIRAAVVEGSEKKVYISVDMRARYADVQVVIQQIRTASIARVAFLTEKQH